MTEVKVSINLKEIQRNGDSKRDKIDEGLFTRGRQEKKDFKPKKSLRSKSRGKKIRCFFICDKEGNFKKDCPNNKDRSNEQNKHMGNVVLKLCQLQIKTLIKNGSWTLDVHSI